jgi:hypothetical protein
LELWLLDGVVTVTGGTVRGARVPGDVPLGVPDKMELALPAGTLGSLICAMAADEIRVGMRTASKALVMA